MKKLTCILMVSILLCGLMLSVSATQDPAETHDWSDFDTVAGAPTLSEDFMTLTIDGETYHRMDTTPFVFDWSGSEESMHLTETQLLQVKRVDYHWDQEKIILQATIYYQDGAILTAGYVKDSSREMLTSMVDPENATASVNYWNHNLETKAPIRDFKENPKVLDWKVITYGDIFYVYGVREDTEIRSQLGLIYTEGGKFYYVDYRENDIIIDSFDPWTYQSLQGYEITNEVLLSDLEKNTAVYYSDGVGMLYDDDFTEVLSIAVLVLVFGIFPGGLLILAIILLIRNKGYQRKTWAITAGLAASELAVFGVLVGVFVNLIGK